MQVNGSEVEFRLASRERCVEVHQKLQAGQEERSLQLASQPV